MERAAAPTHLDAALQTPTRGARCGRTGRVGVKEQPAQSPHTKAAPLRIQSPAPGPACHTEAGFQLLCCGEEATIPTY